MNPPEYRPFPIGISRGRDTRAYLWYVVLFLSVVRKDIERWNSKGRRMVIYELGRTEREKKRIVEEKGDYYETFVNMMASSELHQR